MLTWMEEKQRIADDQQWGEGTNLDRKLQKHEAFELELKANADRLGGCLARFWMIFCILEAFF